jgi:peptide-methionine (R)-S-oxide reductase
MRNRGERTGVTRREFLGCITAAAALGSLPAARVFAATAPRTDDVLIVQFTAAGVRDGAVKVPKVVKTEREWRQQLSPLAFDVTRHAGTERSFTGAYWDFHEKGVYRCVCCNTALFSSTHKFDPHTGWPSFWKPIADENVVGPRAQTPGADPTEVTCHRCDAHLGDIYNDGPRPTGLRYCIDSVALTFVKAP